MHRLSACRAATHRVPAYKCLFGSDDTSIRELSFFVWVVVGDGTVGIIDAGLPSGEDLAALRSTGPYDDVVSLAEILDARELAPDDIDWCAITQSITYHTGGLIPSVLPRAHVYLARAGLDEFLHDRPGHPPAPLYFTAESWSFLRQLSIQRRLHLVDAEVEIAPGVVFEPTGGHHPGSAAVRVTTSDGVVAVLETAFVDENLSTRTPVGLAEDVATCRAVIERYVDRYDVVAPGHEPANVVRFP